MSAGGPPVPKASATPFFAWNLGGGDRSRAVEACNTGTAWSLRWLKRTSCCSQLIFDDFCAEAEAIQREGNFDLDCSPSNELFRLVRPHLISGQVIVRFLRFWHTGWALGTRDWSPHSWVDHCADWTYLQTWSVHWNTPNVPEPTTWFLEPLESSSWQSSPRPNPRLDCICQMAQQENRNDI